MTSVLDEAERNLDRVFEALARERLTDLDNRLNHAHEALEREAEFEREAKELEAAYARRQRRQRIAIAVLLVALLILGAYLLFGV